MAVSWCFPPCVEWVTAAFFLLTFFRNSSDLSSNVQEAETCMDQLAVMSTVLSVEGAVASG